ncbi:O-antigen ligase family protein [Erythrobacter donghaensis]|uniref:O-antigen ligase family protein n=1 Tax=Erythrobacter donghaensis TaxID=267135 RepID=UPI001180E753|nr:O-antigen ligase family protein [Erythrobacter donghaensis]
MDRHPADRITFPLIIVLLLVAFLAGGGGIGAALANLTVQLAALAVLALRPRECAAFWRESPLALRLLILATLALPLLQLVPLPESIWRSLPGRTLVERSLELVGGAQGWRPFSVNPLRTALALTALVTPLAVLLAAWRLPRARLIDLGWIIVGCGIVTAILGAVQLGAAGDAGTFYGSPAPGEILLGTFANRNSTALFLIFALALALLLPAPRPHPAVLPARLAVSALLLLAVVLTQSRTGVVLALLPIALGLARALAERRRGGSAGRAVLIGLGALAVLGAGLGTLMMSSAPGRIGATLERFEAKDDPRRFIWDDATFSAERYWPLGAGMGTFDEIYQVDESLENLTKRRAGRAHNDYIELAIEAGAPGLALAAAWMVLIGWLSWRVRRSSQRWVAWSGSAFLLAIALQSITDYPLRNQTILALAGLALLLLARTAFDHAQGDRRALA